MRVFLRRALLLAGAIIALLPPAGAQTPPIPNFNPSQLQIPATGADFNTLIRSINAILVPLVPGGSAGVNLISLTGGVTGSPAVIGLQSGADANAGIQINPNGSGNIVLFSQTDTGVLQIGNQASFVPANSFVACPGATIGHPPFGMKGVVSGYFAMKDWLGRNQWSLTCG